MEKCQADTYSFFYYGGKVVVCFEATCHVIWLHNFFSTLEVVHPISRPLKLF